MAQMSEVMLQERAVRVWAAMGRALLYLLDSDISVNG